MKFRPILVTGMLAAGMIMAQAPPPANTQAAKQNTTNTKAGTWQDRAIQRMTDRLNLTPDQQSQVRSIFQDTENQNKAVMSKVREERSELKSAVESNSVAKIDQVTQRDAKLNAEVEANHLKAMAKVYQILTPDQQKKFDQSFMTGRFAHNHANNS